MAIDPSEHPAQPEQPQEGFAEGEDNPEAFPEDETVGRFSEGQEDLPAEDPEKLHHGRFSEGQEELPGGGPREARGAALLRGPGRGAPRLHRLTARQRHRLGVRPRAGRRVGTAVGRRAGTSV